MIASRPVSGTRTARRLALVLAGSTCALALTMSFAPPVQAQDTAGSLRGIITGATDTATVTATEVATGTARTVPVAADGSYNFPSLRPGTYRLEVTTPEGVRQTDEFEVAVAQNAVFDFDLAEGGAAATDTAAADDNVIIVTGGRIRTADGGEVSASVSQEQIKSLPQTDRNFLSFAAQSPGVVYLDSETDKGIQSGAATRSQVNVFIDGVSLKNKLREGGIAGQQNSRGNPFGQLAVQEFKVLTQNYKAEFEEAGSAIVTAVTKSGTNRFRGEAFGQYTDRGLTEIDAINKRQGLPEPAFKRKQYCLLYTSDAADE